MNLTNFDAHRRSGNRVKVVLVRQCISVVLGMFLLQTRGAELEVRH